MPDGLEITRGDAPLLLSIPHGGTEIPADVQICLASPWLARKDTDWYIHLLYGFARELDVTIVRTAHSRSVIDVNRDPGGVSLYPGQITTELCPTRSFDGEPLYQPGATPEAAEIARRRAVYFEPYHAALCGELARLRACHRVVVLYDAHSIRSRVPRLFDGELPQFNLGTHSGRSCAPQLAEAIEVVCDASGSTRVTNGRFKGGYITRHYGDPPSGVHAVQMELACRGYLREPSEPLTDNNWPTLYDANFAAPIQAVLRQILRSCLQFASETGAAPTRNRF